MSEIESHQSGGQPWRRALVGFVVAFVAALIVLPYFEAPEQTTWDLTADVAARSLTEKSAALLREDGVEPAYSGPSALRVVVLDRLFGHDAKTVEDAHVRVKKDGADLRISVQSEALSEPLESSSRAGGWEAVLVPLVAVLVALFFRQLILGLLGAVWLGATLVAGGNPLTGLWRMVSDYLWGSVADPFNLYIIFFTLALVGMVQVVTRSAGIAGILEKIRGLASSARSTRIATMAMGGAVFFDDYANTVVVGSTMRPLTDARKISREKLAYIVDSTAAPLAGIAIVSTWIGYEVGLFEELSRQIDLGMGGYEIFFAILPLRFYCILTLFMVLLIAWTGRDYGPMLTAERRALAGDVSRPGASLLGNEAFERAAPADDAPPRWYNAVVPVLVVLGAVFVGMYWSGWADSEGSIGALFSTDLTAIGASWARALGDLGSFEAWRDAFGGAESAKVLFWSSILGSAAAIGLAVGQRILSFRDAVSAWLSAIPAMGLAIAILVLAWAIRAVCEDLGTSIYLVGAVQDILSPYVLPLVTFLLAGVVAFATGTSWGTMGILLPAMIPLAMVMTDGVEHGSVIVLLSFGAVLDGAIFGDHCSPISDTTVMSSMASSCDHVDHVRTQAPYAITTMILAALAYLGVAYGVSAGLLYALAGALLVGIVFAVGRSNGGPEEKDQKTG